VDLGTLMLKVNPITARGFAWFRSIFGVYLFVHFVPLIDWAGEVWGNNGLLPDARVNLTYGVLPDVLSLLSDGQLSALIALLAGCALVLATGYFRTAAALVLWMGWVLLFNRNNFIGNPSLAFIGWLLLVCAVVPSGERRWFDRRTTTDWQFPRFLFQAAWWIMAAAYSISGFDKLNSTSWCDGSAMLHLLENPLARPSALRVWMLDASPWVWSAMTYGVLFIEISFLPFALFGKTRKWIWLAMVLTHLGILVFVDFADLTLGMLMIHAFTYDPLWWKGSSAQHTD
jgi:hypothetical protein